MKDRGKGVEVSGSNWFTDYCSSSDLPCRKHPSSSSVGICAHCLKDRLVKLVCSDCGEQRLSSCSCSDISSYRNSCSIEVGSVGRISFLIENERADFPRSDSKPACAEKAEDVVFLKRSSSCSIDVKRTRLWRFRRFFRRKREKGLGFSEKNFGGSDEKGEMWVYDCLGVSRSGSVTGGEVTFSGDGASDNISGNVASESGFKGVKKDESLELESGFSVLNRSSFPASEEADFTVGEDTGFIDLKLGFSSESKSELSGLKMDSFSELESEASGLRGGDFSRYGCGSFGHLRGKEIWSNGRSCRITVNEKESKKSNKSSKVWSWMFRH